VRAGFALLLLTVAAGVALSSSSAAATGTQTLVFDVVVNFSFVDKPPAGNSPGDTEHSTGRLRDAAGHFVGTVRTTCVFTKVLANDVLERCTASARTVDGTVRLAGIGHLNSMNPPWQVTGRSGAYGGMHGTLVFETDIPFGPVTARGHGYSVAVIVATANHRLRAGAVSRPAANASFIRRADTACRATEAKAAQMSQFPFSNFDPFHPDKKVLPRVGRFFDQPARRALPGALLGKLLKIGPPPAGRAAWQKVLNARRALIVNEAKQIKAALAADVPAFVHTVYQQGTDYNELVFTSAVFGVQSCTFS
jgi:hypothetical protein